MGRSDTESDARTAIEKIKKANAKIEESRRTLLIIEQINAIFLRSGTSAELINIDIIGDRVLWKDLYETFSRYVIRLINDGV